MSTSTWVPPDTFGDRLLRVRKALKLTVEKAATTSGRVCCDVVDMERGAHPRDLLDVVQRISSALNVDRDWLMWGADINVPPTTDEYLAGSDWVDCAPACDLVAA